MKYLIIPAAGKQTRFNTDRPKWLLTLPSGALVIQEIIVSLDVKFDMIVMGVRPEHANFKPRIISEVTQSIFKLVEIKNSTSPVDTVMQLLKTIPIQDGDEIFIKDSDSIFSISSPQLDMNAVVYTDITNETMNVPQKSFLHIDKNNIIERIVEKKIVSPHISVGGYFFKNPIEFMNIAEFLLDQPDEGEIYISHVVEAMRMRRSIFKGIKVNEVIDVGTQEAWNELIRKDQTVICDIDGVVVENQSRYFTPTWDEPAVPIQKNVDKLLKMQEDGSYFIFVTSRTSEFRAATFKMLMDLGFRHFELVMDVPHAPRVLINDYSGSNPYPTATAINVKRNQEIP